MEDAKSIPKIKAKDKFNKMAMLNIAAIVLLISAAFIKNIPWNNVISAAQASITGGGDIPALKPDISTFQPFIKIMTGIIKVFGSMLIGLQMLRLMLDMAYIALPALRPMFEKDSKDKKDKPSMQMESDSAKEAAKQDLAISSYIKSNTITFILLFILLLLVSANLTGILDMVTKFIPA